MAKWLFGVLAATASILTSYTVEANHSPNHWSNNTNAETPPTDGFLSVDPFIGTANGGHVFPGATLPFGMVKASADSFGDNQGGFTVENDFVYGFSHMHDSGTGGSPSLGNFPIFVETTCLDDDVNKCPLQKDDRKQAWVRRSLKAYPGYFAIQLASGIKAEITASNRTALYRFTMPSQPEPPLTGPVKPFMLLDLIDLPESRMEGSVEVNPATGRMTGSGTFNPSFGIGTYDLHFCADFKGMPILDTGVWMNNRAGSSAKKLKVVPDGINIKPPLAAGAYVRFGETSGNSTITARVGMSFISTEQACSNAEKEIPDFDFTRTLATAEAVWREKLSVVEVDSKGVTSNITNTFWSGIYRSMFSPQDYTGENPLWKSDEPYYDSYYCIWDSYRSIHQLLTILDPDVQTRMVRSLIDIYRHEGWLPDCRMSLCKGFTQGGSNADTLLVDSWAKGIRDGIDWNTGYDAMIKDAEEEPLNWSVEGRGGLASWKSLGYIPKDDFDPSGVGPFTRSVSRTVEYAYNDFNIATVAKYTDREADYLKYVARSENWRNLFKEDQTSTLNNRTYYGFLQPKYANGTWAYQDPLQCSNAFDFAGCYLNPAGKETYEGSPWLYSFYAPGDMASIIEALGGPERFIDRLDFFHDPQEYRVGRERYESPISYIGDEQFFLPVFLYHYAGRPGLSAKMAHYYIPRFFFDAPEGLPGNDDSGAMGSFAALTIMGVFPNPGQNVYFITPPFFREVSITSRVTGRKATIRNINFDGDEGTELGAGYKNIYIQSATLDGVPYTKSWISHDFFLKGGVLELTLGPEESKWGTRPEDLPPSLSTTGLAPPTVVQKEWFVT